MFNNYKKYYENYCKYLKTQEAQMNTTEMEHGFANIETLIMHIYGNCLNYRYYGKYYEDEDRVLLTDSTINGKELSKSLKLKDFGEYTKKEYSYIDTVRSIGNFVFFDGTAYVFTDYGLVQMYGRSSEDGNAAKIYTIDTWLFREQDKTEIEKLINHSLIEIPTKNIQKNLTVCTDGSYGIHKSSIEVKPFDCDLKKNYNDDLPYDKLTELINSDEEELILLHGEPGTGKTSIIKKLIHDNPDVEFLYFDSELFKPTSDGKMFDFLSEHKQHVFIIEDCEKLFIDRNNGNRFLNSMLNLTDGIIGEAFGIKFICTFNCHKSKIDPAVLREGRLSLIYEFKKLSIDKVKSFIPNATQEMTLAQIYHTEDNGNKKNDKKIGF